MARELTEAARAAKEIRTALRKRWPGTAFTVRSDNYSMGDAVRIRWTVRSPLDPRTKDVDQFCGRWERGYFDGSTDMYVYNPNRGPGPTTKYVCTQADYEPLMAQHRAAAARYYGVGETAESWTDNAVHARLGCWAWEGLMRYLELKVWRTEPETIHERPFTILAVRQSRDPRVHPSLYLEWTDNRDTAMARLLARAAPEVQARVLTNELQVSAVGVDFVLAHPKRVVLDSESKRWVRPTEGGEWSTVHP